MDGTPTNADVVIRSATDADAFPISFLLGDLGYPIEPALIVEKLAAHETSTASAWRSRAASSGTMRTAFTLGLGSLHARLGSSRLWADQSRSVVLPEIGRHLIPSRAATPSAPACRFPPFSTPPIFQGLERLAPRERAGVME